MGDGKDIVTQLKFLPNAISTISEPLDCFLELHSLKKLLLRIAAALSENELKIARELLDGSSLSTLVQMVSAGIGVTMIPEIAVPIETKVTSVSVPASKNPQLSRTIVMIWRKSSPLTDQLMQISEVVCLSAEGLRGHTMPTSA